MDTDDRLNVVVVGLGYVGLTLGVALARRGIRVYGIERRQEVVDLTNKGIPHFAEVGLESALSTAVNTGHLSASRTTEGIPQAAYYVITVGTPLLAGTYEPRLDMIESATSEVAAHMPDNATVILRSTVRIGTTRDVVRPILESSGRKFHLAMCPERTLEGDALRELTLLPQIVGGSDPAAAGSAAALFSRLTSTIVRVADPETAEMIKLIDNTSRDVRFAFANEVARACDAIGVSANDVIHFGKLGYPRTDVARPGLVGGPCLEKDPHILAASLDPFGVDLEITRAARTVNERQPAETVDALLGELARRKPGPYTAVVAGVAFKGRPETDDLRGSMSLSVINELRRSGRCSTIRVFDPVVPIEALQAVNGVEAFESFASACTDADVLIIANNHPVFSTIDVEATVESMADDAVIFDYWNNLADRPAETLSGTYFTVGNIAGKY